jgi:hypothetical protein
LFKELILRKILLVVLGLMAGNAYADDGSPDMKAAAKALIQAADYQCNKVNGVYPAHFSNAFTVFCDDVYEYTIKDRGGRWTVEVND